MKKIVPFYAALIAANTTVTFAAKLYFVRNINTGGFYK
jgi:hypothetical protein